MFIFSFSYKNNNGIYYIEGNKKESKVLYFVKNLFESTSTPSIFAIIAMVNYTW